MPSKPGFVHGTLRKFVLPLAVLLAVVSVAADGPVNVVAGVTIASDNNDSEGETWGRPGGRTIVYNVGDISALDTLTFGATSLPTAAFDNAVNAPGETMTFDPSSNLAAGIARWTGTAILPVAPGQPIPPPIPTRFTMTIKNASDVGVLLTNFAGGPTPGIDVTAVGASFSVNLLFEALAPPGFAGAGTWVPLLNFYDAAPTPIGNPPDEGGPALTGFSRGFFFTNEGLTLEEHDDNISAQLASLSGQVASVKGDTSFTKAEVTGGLQGLAGTLGEVRDSVAMHVKPGVDQINSTASMTQNRVNEIFNMLQGGGQIPQDIARQSDVQNVKDEISNILQILIGLKPCPLPADQCAALTLMPQVARQANLAELQQAVSALATQADLEQFKIQLDQILIGLSKESSVQEVKDAIGTLATHAGVEQIKQRLNELGATIDQISAAVGQQAASLASQIVELDASSHRRRWLVSTSVSGAPAAAVLTRLVAVNPGKQGPAVAGDVTDSATVTQLMPGLMEVTIEIDKQKLSDLSFHFSFSHSSGGETLSASSLVGGTKTN